MFPSFSTIKQEARYGLKNIWLITSLKEVLLAIIGGCNNSGLILYQLCLTIYMNIIVKFFDSSNQYASSLKTFNIIMAIVIAVSLIQLAIRSGMKIGLNKYYLELANNPNSQPKSRLFANMGYFATQMSMEFARDLYVSLLTLLFIIPGIISSLKWSMAELIIAENPNMRPSDALIESAYVMDGHKKKYFWFCLSFTPWILLCCLSFGIGFIWLVPYMKASHAKFYYYIKNPQYTSDKNVDELKTLKAEKFSFDDFVQEYEEKMQKKQNMYNKK